MKNKKKPHKPSVRDRSKKNPKAYLMLIAGLVVIVFLNWVIYKLVLCKD